MQTLSESPSFLNSNGRPVQRVALMVLVNPKRQFLMNKRTKKQTFAEMWEFPGGKIELDESAREAASRECLEETGLHAGSCQSLVSFGYAYPKINIEFHVYLTHEFKEADKAFENTEQVWLSLDEVSVLPMPDANQIILSALQRVILC